MSAINCDKSAFSSSSWRRPALRLRWRWGRLKWFFHRQRLLCQGLLVGPRCELAREVSLQGSLRLRGPGRVIVESGVIIGDKVDLFTHHRDAVIRIGAGAFLNGTRFSAVKEIRVGANAIIGDARLMDTDFHWLHRHRRSDPRPPPVAPIHIEDNVWIAAGAAVLKGSTIGANSVIAFGAVVSGVVPRDELWAGVPARRISPLPEPPESETLP